MRVGSRARVFFEFLAQRFLSAVLICHTPTQSLASSLYMLSPLHTALPPLTRLPQNR